jgi:uncharacterized protein (DUF4415 family)
MKSKSVKISSALRTRYEKRRLALEKAGAQDADSAMLPIEFWEKGVIGKHYRPLKTPVSVRIDNDVLAWLKSQGDGYLTRINDILRREMTSSAAVKR